MFINHIASKGLVPRIYKELSKIDSKHNSFKNVQRLTHFYKKNILIVNKHIKIFTFIKENQTKNHNKFTSHP